MNLLPIIGYVPFSDIITDNFESERTLMVIASWESSEQTSSLVCSGHPGGQVLIILSHPEFETRPATEEQRGPGGEVAGLIVYLTYSKSRVKFIWSQPYLVSENEFTTTPVGEVTCRPSFPTAALQSDDISAFVGVRTTIPAITLRPCETAVDRPGKPTPNIEDIGSCDWSWEIGKFAEVDDTGCDEDLDIVPYNPFTIPVLNIPILVPIGTPVPVGMTPQELEPIGEPVGTPLNLPQQLPTTLPLVPVPWLPQQIRVPIGVPVGPITIQPIRNPIKVPVTPERDGQPIGDPVGSGDNVPIREILPLEQWIFTYEIGRSRTLDKETNQIISQQVSEGFGAHIPVTQIGVWPNVLRVEVYDTGRYVYQFVGVKVFGEGNDTVLIPEFEFNGRLQPFKIPIKNAGLDEGNLPIVQLVIVGLVIVAVVALVVISSGAVVPLSATPIAQLSTSAAAKAAAAGLKAKQAAEAAQATTAAAEAASYAVERELIRAALSSAKIAKQTVVRQSVGF